MLRSKFILAASALLISALGSSVPSSAQEASSNSGIQMFPPKNLGAGQGLLYFPAGGSQSLYAVPVENDPALIAALNNQVTAINNQTAHLTAALQELTKAIGSGAAAGAGAATTASSVSSDPSSSSPGTAGKYQLSCVSNSNLGSINCYVINTQSGSVGTWNATPGSTRLGYLGGAPP